MEIIKHVLEGVIELRPKVFGDERGWFMEAWNARAFADAGISLTFVQDNQAYSALAGTLRGLHYQLPPAAQTKLVRVLRGAILDVAVDIRSKSPTFKRHVAIKLSASLRNQLLIPKGFAHGYITLMPDTEVIYKVDAHYSPKHDRAIAWNDLDIGIQWPLPPTQGFTLSQKDSDAPPLSESDVF